MSHGAAAGAASWTLGGLAILGGVGVVAGFLTPVAAAAVGLSLLLTAAPWTSPDPAALVVEGPSAALAIAVAVALAMLGPGAHSIDAWLFGRREIVIPDDAGTRRPLPRSR